jgi:hypothetical protein
MNKTVQNIIKAYYAKGLIWGECSKLCHDAYLCGDLVQEVTLIMLGKDSKLISELNEKGELLFYIYKVAKNQFCSKTSPFYSKYVKFQNLIENEEIV